MTPDRSDFALEEYRALRATIRDRGTTRVVVMTITFVVWAGLALAAAALHVFPPLALVPLLALAAGFEGVFALHVGVERIGRYLQTRYETGDGLPAWEHTAMKFGAERRASGGIDPLFTWPFVLAGVLNLLITVVLHTYPGDLEPGTLMHLEGPSPAAFAVFALIHAVFVSRVLSARRFARTQRERDLQLLA